MTSLRPIIIIGAARSGTKFLRDLLASSPDVASVPYDVNYLWRHGNEALDHDVITPDMVDDRQRAHIRAAVERLARKNARGNPRYFVEKTVSNTLRPDLVTAVFPDATLVYVERDGRDVIESAVRQWQAPADRSYLVEKLRYFPVREWRYALWFARNTVRPSSGQPIWGPRYPGIEGDVAELTTPEVCTHQWTACVDGWRNRADRVTPTIEIRYGDLFDDGSTVRHLTEQLGIGGRSQIQTWFAENARPVRGSWPGKLTESESQRVEELLDGWQR